jgi:hypothetical protein
MLGAREWNLPLEAAPFLVVFLGGIFKKFNDFK